MPRKKKQSSGTIRIKNGRVVSFDLHGPAADVFVKGMMKAFNETEVKKDDKEDKKP